MANTTSGSYTFDKTFAIDDTIAEAYERIGLVGSSGHQLLSARRSLNLLFQEWGNRGIHYWDVANNNFTLDWVDDFDYFDSNRWEKATHTWTANNAQFVHENAVLQYGYLILCLTDNTTSGYSGDPLSVLDNKNNDTSKTLMVYPNPFNSSFTIQTVSYTHLRAHET